jgi:8-oxo-dGTP diphosphatase
MESARPAGPDDRDRLTVLWREAGEEARAQRGGLLLEAMLTPDATPDHALDDPDRLVAVGRIDEVVVGFVTAHLGEHAEPPVAVIDILYVEPPAREIGVGEALAGCVLEWATERRCQGVDASALPGNRRAKAFFEDNGFVARVLTMHRPLPSIPTVAGGATVAVHDIDHPPPAVAPGLAAVGAGAGAGPVAGPGPAADPGGGLAAGAGRAADPGGGLAAEPDPVRLRAETCVGAIAVDAGRLLLVRRGRGVGVGRWSIPGGRVEPGETLAQAVVRELREETGLAGACGVLVGWAERIGDDHHFVILDFLVSVPAGTEPVAGDDAAEAAWVALADVGTRSLVDGLEDFLLQHGILGPHT